MYGLGMHICVVKLYERNIVVIIMWVVVWLTCKGNVDTYELQDRYQIT